jgi:hypothetical protein
MFQDRLAVEANKQEERLGNRRSVWETGGASGSSEF